MRSQNLRDPPLGAGIALTSVPSFSSNLAKIANPESLKCSETICIFIGFRKSGLSVPYHNAESLYEI